jgi:uncharacterized protein
MNEDVYRPRAVDIELDLLLPELAALAVEGPKGVGKTATAERRARTVLSLDEPEQLAQLIGDPGRILRATRPLLIDEWQRSPRVWDQVRRAVDSGAAPGSFLLTGSAVPIELPAHSGAGRIGALRMRPMALSERGIETPTVSLGALLGGGSPSIDGSTDLRLPDYVEEIVRSGLPGIRDLGWRALRNQLDAYLARLAERDFTEVGHRVRAPTTLRRWMAAYAAATATTATYETIRRAATSGEGTALSRATTQPYRDALERLYVLDPLPAWSPTRNRIARLSFPPKHHLADPALAARLLGAGVDNLLDLRQKASPIPRDGLLVGALFESLVTLCVRVYAQVAEATVGHLRTTSGAHEIDLIVERENRIVAIEVKLAQTIDDRDVRHLHWLAGQLGDDLMDMVVVTTGPYAYRRPDGVAVVPAALLGP